MDWNKFLTVEKETKDAIITKKMYVVITGDLQTAHLLYQIIYWFLPGKKGNSKIRINKDGKQWIAKKRTDWWDECCLTEFQFDRSIKVLRKLNLVGTKIYKFNGEPTIHITLNKEILLEIVNEYVDKSKEDE